MSDHTHHHAHSHAHSHGHGEAACCDSHAAPVLTPLGKPVADGSGVQTPIRILQMDCPTEEALLRSKLGGVAGVAGLEFNLVQRVLTVTHAPEAIESILAAVRSLGYTPELAQGSAPPLPEPAKPWSPLVLAGVAAIASEAAHFAALPTWVPALLALLAIATCGLTTYKKG